MVTLKRLVKFHGIVIDDVGSFGPYIKEVTRTAANDKMHNSQDYDKNWRSSERKSRTTYRSNSFHYALWDGTMNVKCYRGTMASAQRNATLRVASQSKLYLELYQYTS